MPEQTQTETIQTEPGGGGASAVDEADRLHCPRCGFYFQRGSHYRDGETGGDGVCPRCGVAVSAFADEPQKQGQERPGQERPGATPAPAAQDQSPVVQALAVLAEAAHAPEALTEAAAQVANPE